MYNDSPVFTFLEEIKVESILPFFYAILYIIKAREGKNLEKVSYIIKTLTKKFKNIICCTNSLVLH